MKVIATLDYIDGSKSKSRRVYLDQLDTTYLRLKLCEPGVASITITRADLLTQLNMLTINTGE